MTAASSTAVAAHTHTDTLPDADEESALHASSGDSVCVSVSLLRVCR